MKIPFKMLVAASLITATTGCKSFLDINGNPNLPTAVTPDAILAQALTATAQTYTGGTPSVQNSFNSYASWVASYWGKTAVVSGYGEEQTYNYSSLFYAGTSGLWNNTYDNLNDYNLIQVNGAANGYPNHAAIARIMKVYNFQLLVDEYGDIPYSQALMGATNVTPTYDKAADIYKDLLVQLDGAIADINKAAAAAGSRTVGPEDIVFQGNMKKWKQFANSLKLRILLRESQTSDATVKTQLAALQTSAAADGFITADVVAQPTYAQASGQQNPLYNRYAYTAAGANATERSYQIPTQYILNQYIVNKDPRVSQLYVLGKRVVGKDTLSQYVGSIPGESNPPNVVLPLIGSRFLGANAQGVTGGFFKGLNAPTVLMSLSEHLFSKSEAETRNLFTGGDAQAKVDYLAGIQASFSYYYRSGTADPATVAGTAQYNTYIAANTTNGLVDWDTNTTTTPQGTDLSTTLLTVPRTVSKQEKIIYQKYLALNTFASTEAWDDYRRTAFPKLPFASQSASPRPDKLPTRLLYPQSEINTNQKNIPTDVTQFTKIFWDVVD